jgi:glycosyltransferase involved in cell wall biosynthesis
MQKPLKQLCMEKNLRVLFLDTRPIRRGAQVFVHDLKQRLSAEGISVRRIFLYEENKYEQLVLDENDMVMPFREDHIFEKIPSVHPSLVMRIAKEIRSFSPDIILCNGSRTLKYAAFVKKIYPRITSKWVYRVIDSAVYWNRRSITQLYYRHFVIPAMDGAVGVSQKSLDEMTAHYRFKKPSVCIPRAINVDHFAQYLPDDLARENAGISKDAFVLLFLGNFTQQKRPDRFVNIIHILQKDIPQVHGLMVGDGELKNVSLKLVEKLGLTGKITFAGYQQDVRPWISMSDILLLTSDTEGMPGVVLEAGAMKKCTVSTDVGGIREVILDNENGFIVINGYDNIFISKILHLNNSKDLRIKFENSIFESILYRNKIEKILRDYLIFFNKIKLGL